MNINTIIKITMEFITAIREAEKHDELTTYQALDLQIKLGILDTLIDIADCLHEISDNTQTI